MPPHPHTGDLFESSAAAASPAPVRRGLGALPAAPLVPARAARELWLGLALPRLPLVALRQSEPGRVPGAQDLACVIEGSGSAQVVVVGSAQATKLGVVPGLGLNAALALVPGLELLERRPLAERALLERLARWGLQFTPLVSLEPPDGLLAEVRGSLGLFGGVEALRRRALDELRGLGIEAVAAVAPTPRAATWFARATAGLCIDTPDRLPALAGRLPLGCLRWPDKVIEGLVALGVHSVADLVRLPRDGFARRFGTALLDELDEAFGRRPAPRRRVVVPERFDERLELPVESESTRLIELALERLLAPLEAFLRARSAGVRGVMVELSHRGRPATRFRLGLARPGGDARHLLSLLGERLARLPLPAPATAVRLRSGVAVPLDLRDGALLERAGRDTDPEAAARLLERLRARFGSEAVFSVCLVPEHRPEAAWRVAEPALRAAGPSPACPVGAAGVPVASEFLPSERSGTRSRTTRTRRGPRSPVDAEAPIAPRPLWMLAEPERLDERDGVPRHDGPLELLSGPERIETGWWDGRDARRDYFVAGTRAGVRLWVYRERGPDGGWWLHGVFG